MTDLTIERLATLAGEAIFDRGQRYFRGGRVLSWTAEGTALRGRVKGSDQYPYRVEIDLRPARPVVRCTCPFDMGSWCKHAVAVAMSYCVNGTGRNNRPPDGRGDRPNGNGREAGQARSSNGRGAPEPAGREREAPDEEDADDPAGGSRRTRRRRRSRRRRRDTPEEARADAGRAEAPLPEGPTVPEALPPVPITAGRAAVDLGSPLLNLISARGTRQVAESAQGVRRFRYRLRQSSEGLELVIVDQRTAQQITGLRPMTAGHAAMARRRPRRGRHVPERQEEIKLRRADEILFQFLLAHGEVDPRRKLHKIPFEDAATLLHLLSAAGGVFDDWTGERIVFSAEPARLVLDTELTGEGGLSMRASWRLPAGERPLGLADARLFAGDVSWLRAGAVVCRVTPRASALAGQLGIAPEQRLAGEDVARFLFEVASDPAPGIEIRLSPEASSVTLQREEPRVALILTPRQRALEARLAFEYGGARVGESGRYVRAGGGAWIERDETAEDRARQRLIEWGFSPTVALETFVAIGDAALDFISNRLVEVALEWQVYGADTLGDFRISKKAFDLTIDVDMGSAIDWFTLDISAKAGSEVIDIGLLQHALVSGERYIQLSDGSHVEIPRERLAKLSEAINSVQAQPEQDGSFRVSLFEANELADRLGEGDGVRPSARFRQFLKKLKGFEGIGKSEPPRALKATLRPYQQRGLDWLWFLNRYGLGGVLADDMGLGKTVQALAVLLKSKKAEGRKPSLVVVPASVVMNWSEEAARFAPSLSVLDLTGPGRTERFEKIADSDLIVTNYALLRRDVDRLGEIEFRYVILDEAQNIKNPESQTARASKRLRAEHRLALTGTPIENRLSELWSIFDFLDPGLLGTLARFRQQYETPIAVRGDREAEARLRRRIYPFILRRMKQEVADDLPDKIEAVVHCELTPEQRALYRDVLAVTKQKVFQEVEEKGIAGSHISILAALVKLRQICCHPRLLKLPVEEERLTSAKFELLQEMIHELISEGHRALIFSQFTQMLAIVREWLDEEQIEYEYLDGSTKDRGTCVRRFNEDPTVPLFLISLKAGGTGLNLTGADYVIHYDPWWNPAVEDQATDRAYRIGQTRNVFAYKLITKGTVEDKLLELQGRKRDLVAGVLGAESTIGKSLTREDLEDLFTFEE
jgi:superfamily II DNA or RNA helicase